MTRRVSGLLLGVAAAGVAALSCKSDPTSSLATNTPATISTTVSRLVVSQGDTGAFQASVLNSQLVPLTLPVTFAACSGTVGTVGVRGDTSYHPPVANKFQAAVAGVAIGPACVVVSGGGLTDTVDAPVAPIIFLGGTVSNLTPMGGATITLKGTSLLKFNTDAVAVFGGPSPGIPGETAISTADSIVVVVPFSTKAPLKIDSIAPSYITTNRYVLSMVDTVAQTGDYWDGDSSAATAPALIVPAAGDSMPMITNLFARDNKTLCPGYYAPPDTTVDPPDSTVAEGPCMFYTFSVPGPDSMTLSVSMDWDGSPATLNDLDVFACAGPYDAAACVASPEGAKGITHSLPDSATTKPEAFKFKFPPGVHYLVVQRWQTWKPLSTLLPRNIRLKVKQQ